MCQIGQNAWGRTGFSVKSVEPLQKDNMLHAKLIGLEKGKLGSCTIFFCSMFGSAPYGVTE